MSNDTIANLRTADPPVRDGAPIPRTDCPVLQILLAEDNPVNQALAIRMLQKMGHAVTVAGNGRDAVAAAGKQIFDLVLMDVQMPELGGLEATRAIREMEAATRRHVPIIAMTAHAMKGDREKCLAAGMDGYIAKPIRPADLTAEIERCTRLRDEPVSPSVCDDVLDWEEAWANVEGDRTLFSELAGLFLDDLPQQMEGIHRAAEQRRPHDLERFAHRLKGSVGNFAAQPAFEAASRLEQVARDGKCDQFVTAVDAVEREIQRLQNALEQWSYKLPQASPGVPASGSEALSGDAASEWL